MASDAFNLIVELTSANDTLDMPLAERRIAIEEGALAAPPPDDVEIEFVDAGGVPAEWVGIKGASPDRVILYVHGGAYVICSPRTHRRLTSALAREADARVLAIDYRLAPEHPFPAAVDDAVAAYTWLLDTGVPAEHIAIAGDSAGGGLIVAALVAIRDSGLPMPSAATAISPWADLEFTGESFTTKADVDPMLDVPRLKESADMYLAGQDPRTPLASPIYADLHGVPPLLIHVGGREVLLDDARRLAARAQEHGVDVTLEIEEEMIHVWHVFAGMCPESDDAVRGVARFFTEHWS